MADSVGRRRDESGFTLVELVAAMGVMFAVLVGMAYASTVALVDVGYARQRQGATGLANEAIEQIRALPFQTLRRGLSSTDLTGDTRITSGAFKGESLIQSIYPVGSLQEPLVPHTSTKSVGQTSYRVSTYVTAYNNTTASGALRVTVVVSWAAKMRAGARGEVEIQTVVHPGSGCQSTAVHPYAAPCQDFYYGSAGVEVGTVTITGTLIGNNNGVDEYFDEGGILVLPTQRSVVQSEQVTALQSTSITSGVTLKLTGVETKAGQVAVTLAGDDDPARPAADYQTADNSGQLQSDVPLSTGRQNLLVVTPSAVDPASATVAARATTTNTCAGESDSLPCSTAAARQANQSKATVTFMHPVAMGEAVLASVGGTSTLSRTTADLRRETSGTVCTGRGCIRSRVERSLGTVGLAGLPEFVTKPSGWQDYFVKLTGYADAATAEAGEAVSSPEATVSSGALSYWDGSGYSTCDLATQDCTDIAVAPLVAYDSSGNQRVEIAAEFVRGAASASPAGCATGPLCAESTATLTAPLTASIKYRVFAGASSSSTVADLSIDVNLGGLLAQSTFKAAPGA